MEREAPDVVLLCGGLGTRLRAALPDRPKALAPIGGRPFIELLLDHFARHGFKRFVLCVGHGAEAMRRALKSRPGRELVFSEEKTPLGTGGALKLAGPLISGGAFLAANGDSLCAFDPWRLLELRASRATPVAVALAKPGDRLDGGYVRLAPDGRILSFDEKDPTAASRPINAGVLALDRSVLDSIPAGQACSFERETIPKLLPRGLYGLLVEEPLYDIGTPERLEAFRKSYRA